MRHMKTPLSNLARPLLSVMLLSVAAASFAAPVGYSVNSDSSNIANEDSLYEINLETGDVTLIAPLSPVKLDVEGLAFDPDGTLYAIDDQIPTLFTLNPANAQVGRNRTAGAAVYPGPAARQPTAVLLAITQHTGA